MVDGCSYGMDGNGRKVHECVRRDAISYGSTCESIEENICHIDRAWRREV